MDSDFRSFCSYERWKEGEEILPLLETEEDGGLEVLWTARRRGMGCCACSGKTGIFVLHSLGCWFDDDA